jgi:hypothetical protein
MIHHVKLYNLIGLILLIPLISSGLVKTDWRNTGDELLSYDITTGLFWLDLTVTRGQSYNYVLNETQNGELSQFRYATLSEVHSMFLSNFDIKLFSPHNTGITENNKIALASSYFGDISPNVNYSHWMRAITSNDHYTTGSQPMKSNTGVYINNNTSSPHFWEDSGFTYNDTEQYVASWLVTDSLPAPVTEVLHNVGGSTTFSIPSDWTISSNAPNFFCHTSSYSVVLNVLSFPATDSQKKIYVSDYDALNTALAPSLYTFEFDYIHQQVNVGGGKLHDMGSPTLNYGPTPNYNFYLGSSYNSYTISVQQYPSILQNILTFNYIFFDGTTIYMARATVNENIATTAEKILLTNVISSASSTAIQSPLEDSDGDGISNYDEVIFYSSDPTLKDTNSDGIDDDVIISLGGNPRWDISSTLEYIEENPQTFNLYSSDNITDLRAGSTMIEVSGNQATVQLQMEESSDLESWTETGAAATMIVPADTDTKFYRFKMAE